MSPITCIHRVRKRGKKRLFSLSGFYCVSTVGSSNKSRLTDNWNPLWFASQHGQPIFGIKDASLCVFRVTAFYYNIGVQLVPWTHIATIALPGRFWHIHCSLSHPKDTLLERLWCAGRGCSSLATVSLCFLCLSMGLLNPVLLGKWQFIP